MYHPDRQLEALYRQTVAIDEARRARRRARRHTARLAFGSRLVALGVRVGGTTAAARAHAQLHVAEPDCG